MAEKVVSSFVKKYLPYLGDIEHNQLVSFLIPKVKDFKKINTVEGRKELILRLEDEIKTLKLINSEACIIIARIFREKYILLKNESDDDLVLVLKLVEPSLGFDFFLRTSEEQKKFFRLANKSLNCPGLRLGHRTDKFDPKLVEQHYLSNLKSIDEKTRRILMNVFKGKEGIGFDAFYLAFSYFFSIKNTTNLDVMDDEALRGLIAPQLPSYVLLLAIMFSYWKYYGKVKLHYMPVFLDCINVRMEENGISVDTLFNEEQLKKLLTAIDELMFVEVSDKFVSSDEEEEVPAEEEKMCAQETEHVHVYKEPEPNYLELIVSLKKRIDEMEADRIKEKKDWKEYERKNDELIVRLKKDNNSLEKKIEEHMLKLEDQLTLMEADIIKEKKNRKEFERKNDELLVRLKKDNNSLEKKIEECKVKLEDQATLNAKWQKKFDKLKSKLNTQKDKYETQITDLKEQYKNVLEQLENQQKTEKEFKDKLEILEEKVVSLSSKLANYEFDSLVNKQKMHL